MASNVKIIEDPIWTDDYRLKLQAVRTVKTQLGLTLKEAKDVVEGKEFHIHESEFEELNDALKACGYTLDKVVNDEDEKIRKEIIEQINLLKSVTLSDLRDKQFNSLIAWLEKQGKQKYTQKDVDDAYLKGVSTTKRMFEKQQNPTWSEEDESMLDEAIYLIRREPYRENDAEPIVDWLNSLKGRVQPQNQWKPSDLQMSALWNNCSPGSLLLSLYNDLKKLKAE